LKYETGNFSETPYVVSYGKAGGVGIKKNEG
jgi:hypothetical protein